MCRDGVEHDYRLRAVLERTESVGVTLNQEKSVLRQDKLKISGHTISADPEKMLAITQTKPARNCTETTVLGMVNQLG